MIGFNDLGRKGNLGNQMFQYAGLRGIAHARGFDWRIPPNDKSRIHSYDLLKYFEMTSVRPENIGYVPHRTYYTKARDGKNTTGYDFNPELLLSTPDNVNINAYLQSDKYFRNCEPLIRADFTFRSPFAERAQEYVNGLGGRIIALHVRRGDYVKFKKHHPPLELDYYRAALSKVPDLPVVICTNDAEWVWEQGLFSSDRFQIASFTDYGVEMAIMSLAEHVIIANSSFSWWGAWLGHHQTVVAPKNWFGEKLRKNSTTDLYLNGWQII